MALQRYEGTSSVDAGLSRRAMSLDGCLLSKVGLGATTSITTEQVLASIVLPVKLLNNNSKGLLFLAWGSTAGNGNNKQIRLREAGSVTDLTGTVIADSGLVAGNAVGFLLEVRLFRTGLTGQDVISKAIIGSTLTVTFTQTVLNSNKGLTNFNISAITPTAAGDITLAGWRCALLTEGGVQTLGGVLV